MAGRSYKEAMAVCAKSGIESLKSRLVKDGYFPESWVLPEYYEPPQFRNRPAPIAELPPFNPQPLIDVYVTTQTLNAGMQFTVDSVGNVPYAISSIGAFVYEKNTELLPSVVEGFSSIGAFIFDAPGEHELIGVEVDTAVGQFGEFDEYGFGSYSEGSYGGTIHVGFEVGFHIGGVSVTSSVGAFGAGHSYGNNTYSSNPYGGI